MKYSAWYCILVGVSMFAQWMGFAATGQIPELQSEPIRIGFHLAGEFITASGLILAGITLLRRLTWSRVIFNIFIGMMLYSVIVSPGYFAQHGQMGLVVMFACILTGAFIAILQVNRSRSD